MTKTPQTVSILRSFVFCPKKNIYDSIHVQLHLTFNVKKKMVIFSYKKRCVCVRSLVLRKKSAHDAKKTLLRRRRSLKNVLFFTLYLSYISGHCGKPIPM